MPSLVPRDLLFRDSFLPRIVIALLAGAGLGLAGTIFQQVLRNPLAEPATLGVSAGAQFALALAMLWSPLVYGAAQGWLALAGGTTGFLLVLGLAKALGFSPTTLVVSGLMVSLVFGALNAILVVLHHDLMSSLFLWQSGSLDQNGWSPGIKLLAESLTLAMLCHFLIRPLELIGIGGDSAKSLGLSVRTVRIMLLAVAVVLSACVTSAVGPIAFVGLAAPAIGQGLGARSLRQRLLLAPALGAGLLIVTDQIVQLMTFVPQEISTGAVTGLLGAPLLLLLLPRVGALSPPHDVPLSKRRLPQSIMRLSLCIGLLILLVALGGAMAIGHTPEGWRIASWPEFLELAIWRVPRAMAAASCGAMLAAAGVLLQRLTGNPAASPEITGISSGATVAVIIAMLLVPDLDPSRAWPSALVGSGVTLAVLLAISRRSSFSPERMLLTGVALISLMTALVSIMLSSGDPRMSFLIGWMSGSTYNVTPSEALLAFLTMVLTITITPLGLRWLSILPLGASSAQAVGVHVGMARLVVLGITAVMTTAATMIVGPLSFVGLIAPHLVRMLGVQRPMPQFFGAAIAGALTMVLADWIGRTAIAPWDIPAGLIASLIGFPFFIWSARRRA